MTYLIEPGSPVIWKCDGCGREATFWHGMTTFYLTNDSGYRANEQSFCSEICVKETVFKQTDHKISIDLFPLLKVAQA